MTNNWDPTDFNQVDFTVVYSISSCTKQWNYHSSDPAPYLETTYEINTGPLTIEFTDVDVSDCYFILKLQDKSKDLAIANNYDTDLLTLNQPTFANSNPSDSRLKSVTSFGSVVVETANEWKLGNYNMLLKVCSERYRNENDCQDLDFKIEVVPCINVYGYSETEIASIQYTQG